jgi:hypothetical protein
LRRAGPFLWMGNGEEIDAVNPRFVIE